MKQNNYNNDHYIESIPIKTITVDHTQFLKKPSWIKIKIPSNFAYIQKIKNTIKKYNLNTICEEASCPNITECFNHGTASFIILGKICTRRCPFCDVTHGRPTAPDVNEPKKLAQAIIDMKLHYIVITSVNRDDLHDGGAKHFSNCILAIRNKNINIRIEILVPDFRGRMENAIKIISMTPPDVFSHNIENVPRLYSIIRPGANYNKSLKLLEYFKTINPHIPTKSGLMLGLGETNKEIIKTISDLYDHGVSMLTIGQYLQPSSQHLTVKRYVSPQEFDMIKQEALRIGFTHAVCGPLVRSSYHADIQFKNIINSSNKT